MEILWSFGPADAELRLTPALGRVPEDRVSVDATPRELARALADAALYVGADTGVTHLAAAVGCPTVALFGPTDERIWCPPGHHVRVLAEGDRWDGESASPCAPSPAGSECARPVGAISPADVLAAARDLLSRADVRTLAPPAGGR
jgi:ADP-heptose:LPS heptosyltransferase